MLSPTLGGLVSDVSPFVVYGFVIITAIVIGIDIFLYVNEPDGDTISNVVRNWAYGKGFALPFIWGVLSTHFFLIRPGQAENPVAWVIIAIIVIAMIATGILRKPVMTPLTMLLLLVFGGMTCFLLTY